MIITKSSKEKSKPISRILLSVNWRTPIIYLGCKLLCNSSCSPLEIERVVLSRQNRISNVHSIAPHRVYLVSLQPNCTYFLLHWSSPSKDGWRMLSAMLPYGVRTFLHAKSAAIRWLTLIFAKVAYICFKKKSHSCKQKWENCYEKEYYY